KKAELQTSELKVTSIMEKYRLLFEQKDLLLRFLNYESLQRSFNSINAQIEFKKGEVRSKLTEERQKVSEYIHHQVENFFYEELINSIYKKIDPHPDCKRITFKCDFNGDKPKLNVFVIGDNDEIPHIPNLYFSTAQLNILSLSIFLAKALNTKDETGQPVDSIFIDDPIQSMDSINILSTIDLLRSIVVNLGKQIILSTHDENFHNLLKKKMPPELFNSKYIELETFGKVKDNVEEL
ncbi:hypothetical protein ACDQ55_06440, partial [Chitinophaga sp. 30R24]